MPLVFGHGRQDVEGEAGGVGHIAGPELHPALHEIGNDRHGAGEPVEFGDEEREALAATEFERVGKLRSVGLRAALDLRELRRELPALPAEEVGNGRLLGFEP